MLDCSGRGCDMLARELAIVLRARVTWVAAALAALLVGHGFVLAVDLFSAGSRSALRSGSWRASSIRCRHRAADARRALPRRLAARPAGRRARRSPSRRSGGRSARCCCRPAHRHGCVGGEGRRRAAGVGAAARRTRRAARRYGGAAGGHLALAETAVALARRTRSTSLLVVARRDRGGGVDRHAGAGGDGRARRRRSRRGPSTPPKASPRWRGSAAPLDWSVTTHLGSDGARHPVRSARCSGWASWHSVRSRLPGWACAIDLASAPRRAVARGRCSPRPLGGTLAIGRRGFDLTEDRARRCRPPRRAGCARSAGRLGARGVARPRRRRRRQLETDTLAKLRIARPDLEVDDTDSTTRRTPVEAERERATAASSSTSAARRARRTPPAGGRS